MSLNKSFCFPTGKGCYRKCVMAWLSESEPQASLLTLRRVSASPCEVTALAPSCAHAWQWHFVSALIPGEVRWRGALQHALPAC